MNLARLVQTALNAVPSGIRGTATVTRTIPGTLDPATDTRTGDLVRSFSAPVVLVTPEGDRWSPMPDASRLREFIFAAADCDFAPEMGDRIELPTSAHVWSVVSLLPVAPSGAAVSYRVRAKAIGVRSFSAVAASVAGQVQAALANLLFSGAASGAQGQASAAVAALRFGSVAAGSQGQADAAVADNGVPLTYGPGDPITATRGSTATFVDAGLMLTYAPGDALTETRPSEATFTAQVWP